MDTWDAITSRRNTRVFSETAIAADDLDRILEAARRTPSSRNSQRWDFVVSTDRAQLQELSKVWRGGAYIARAPVTISLVAPIAHDPHTRESIQYDLGQVTMSIMLAAADLGIATGHSAVEDRALAGKVLGLPDDYFCAWIIALGYPLEPLRPIRRPNRRPFEEVVHRGTW